MKTITNKFKLAVATIGLLAVGTVNAQTTDATSANITRTSADGPSIRLIDNKGTIKYLQSNNGITTITSTTAGNRTTTTWQLGGTLDENTYIDLDGNAFTLNGLKLETGNASTDATNESDHGTGTGWTLLVRDEATGETRKMLATNLIQSGHQVFTITAAQETAAGAGDVDITVTSGAPLSDVYSKVWVYRNGAKLVGNVDYTIAANVVTLKPNATAPNDWTLYESDVIEVQFVK